MMEHDNNNDFFIDRNTVKPYKGGKMDEKSQKALDIFKRPAYGTRQYKELMEAKNE